MVSPLHWLPYVTLSKGILEVSFGPPRPCIIYDFLCNPRGWLGRSSCRSVVFFFVTVLIMIVTISFYSCLMYMILALVCTMSIVVVDIAIITMDILNHRYNLFVPKNIWHMSYFITIVTSRIVGFLTSWWCYLILLEVQVFHSWRLSFLHFVGSFESWIGWAFGLPLRFDFLFQLARAFIRVHQSLILFFCVL